MDFLTALPYWGIFVIVIANAILVRRMKVEINEDPKPDSHA